MCLSFRQMEQTLYLEVLLCVYLAIYLLLLIKYMRDVGFDFLGWVLRTTVSVQAERQAVNTTVQGSAADIVKTATVNIQRRLEAFSSVIKSHGHLESSFQRDKTGMVASSLHTRSRFSVLLMFKKKKAWKRLVPLGLGVGRVLFPDSGKWVFKGQKSHQEGGIMSVQQTKANVTRTETLVTSEWILQRLAVRVHVWCGLWCHQRVVQKREGGTEQKLWLQRQWKNWVGRLLVPKIHFFG